MNKLSLLIPGSLQKIATTFHLCSRTREEDKRVYSEIIISRPYNSLGNTTPVIFFTFIIQFSMKEGIANHNFYFFLKKNIPCKVNWKPGFNCFILCRVPVFLSDKAQSTVSLLCPAWIKLLM